MIENNCLHYEHQDGAPEPESRFSCRGCKHSHDPNLYDPGCRHPDGFQERPRKKKDRRFREVFKRRPAASTRDDKLSDSERRRVNELINRANEAYRDGHFPGAEYR